MSDLKNKTVKGVFWNAVDKFTNQGLQFVFGIILARLLLPKEYGLIGMLSIFISIGQVFVASNFATALIQKKNRTEDDFNTVFLFNVFTAFTIYMILFFSAGFIADFYNEPRLLALTRVVSLSLLLYSLTMIQNTKYTIELNFKIMAKISMVSVLLSGTIGVVLAFLDFGVWSLVWKTLAFAAFNSMGLWMFSSWKPNFTFSKESFKSLFGFSSKLLLADLFDSFYRNMNNVLIGKYYGAESIGYYSRAKQFQDLPSISLTEISRKVTFPVLSSIQDDDDRLAKTYRRIIRFLAFIVIGLMFLLMTIAKPLVLVLLTEKWLPSVEIFQILSFAGIWFPINVLSMEAIIVKGKSGLFLKIDLIKKIIALAIIIIASQYGIVALAYGMVAIALISFVVNAIFTEKVIHYRILSQISDLVPFILVAVSSNLLVRNTMVLVDSSLMQLAIGSFSYILLFLLASRIFRFEEYFELKKLIINLFENLKRRKAN